MTTPSHTFARRPFTRWLLGLVTSVLALALTVVFWPVSFVVAGLFAVGVAVRRDSLPRPVRIALLVVGLAATVTSALVLADFTWGTTQLTVGPR